MIIALFVAVSLFAFAVLAFIDRYFDRARILKNRLPKTPTETAVKRPQRLLDWRRGWL